MSIFSNNKGQGLPHYLDSRDASEPQGPRACPGLNPGCSERQSWKGDCREGKREAGGRNTVNWHEGWELEFCGWFPGYSTHTDTPGQQCDPRKNYRAREDPAQHLFFPIYLIQD